MARDSQPPPPQLIAELQEKLDCLQAEYDEYKVNVGKEHLAVVQERDEQLAVLRNTVRERDEEILYLQGQLESAVGELAELKNIVSSVKVDGHDCKSVNEPNQTNASMPEDNLRLFVDMKNKLRSIEDRLSTCNITQQTTVG